MITYDGFVEYCKQHGMHCVMRDGMIPESKGLTMVFKEQEGRQPDVTVELDFLRDGNVQSYIYGFIEELPNISQQELLARLNIANAYTPHINMLLINSRIVQLCHDVTDSMRAQELMSIIKYRVQMSLFFAPLLLSPEDQYNMMSTFSVGAGTDDEQEELDDDLDFEQEEW